MRLGFLDRLWVNDRGRFFGFGGVDQQAHPGDHEGEDSGAISADAGMAMLNYMPLRAMLSFGAGQIDEAQILSLLEALNQQ